MLCFLSGTGPQFTGKKKCRYRDVPGFLIDLETSVPYLQIVQLTSNKGLVSGFSQAVNNVLAAERETIRARGADPVFKSKRRGKYSLSDKNQSGTPSLMVGSAVVIIRHLVLW